MMMNLSPLRYPGGKYRIAKRIEEIVLENHCSTLIEPFCGGAGVSLYLLEEGIIERAVLNDADPLIYSFWKTVLDNPKDLIERIRTTEISVEEWKKQKALLNHYKEHSNEEIAFAALFLNRTNRSGIIFNAGMLGGQKQEGKYKIGCRFDKDKIIEKIKRISKMKNRIQLFNLDYRQFLKTYPITQNELMFVDPPYIQKGAQLYACSMTEEEHYQLSEMLKKLNQNNWVVTIDDCLYARSLYQKQRIAEFKIHYSLQVKRKQTELMILSDHLRMPLKTTQMHIQSLAGINQLSIFNA